MTATKPLTDGLFDNLMPDEDLIASASRASEQFRRNLAQSDSGVRAKLEQEDQAKGMNDLNYRRHLIESFMYEDRKLALYHLKILNVGGRVVVYATDAQHLRVACTYQAKTYGKHFRTRTFMFGKHKYLEVVREKWYCLVLFPIVLTWQAPFIVLYYVLINGKSIVVSSVGKFPTSRKFFKKML